MAIGSRLPCRAIRVVGQAVLLSKSREIWVVQEERTLLPGGELLHVKTHYLGNAEAFA